MSMSQESIRLASKFLLEVKGFKKDGRGKIETVDLYKKTTIQSFQNLLDNGNEYDNMIIMINNFVKDCDKPSEVYNMEEIFKFYGVTPKQKRRVQKAIPQDSLLKAGRFYYHPALQEAPPPPVVEALPDGTFKSSYDDEEFFLEIKDSFTLDDLVEYMYKRVPQMRRTHREREKGAFKHILQYTELDVLLYAIDEGAVDEQAPRSAFDFEDYVEQAERIYEERQNTLFTEGLDHVIPRHE